jgi:hemoglobin-like flavoprotein
MAAQKRALLGSLGMILGALRKPEALSSYLGQLGERHTGYGAVAGHYDVVGGVLLDTLAEMAGEHWDEELQMAWSTAFGAIKGLMLAGAEQLAA